MKRWMVGLLVCMLAACTCALMAGCQSETYTPSPKEQAVAGSALVEDGTLTVGVNTKNNPMAGAMSDGAIVGLDADLAAFLADEMGLKLKLVDVGDDAEGALTSGKADVVLGVKSSDDGTSTYWKSDAYLATAASLFGMRDETSIPSVDSKPTIAGQVDEATGQKSLSAGAVVKLFGEDSLEGHKDLEEALATLASGAVRYAAGDAIKGLYAADFNGFDVKVVAVMEEPNGYCAAVAQTNTELQQAVAAALGKVMVGGALDMVETTWLGGPVSLQNMTVIRQIVGEPASEPVVEEEAAEGEAEGEGEEAYDGSYDEASYDDGQYYYYDDGSYNDDGAYYDDGPSAEAEVQGVDDGYEADAAGEAA